MFADWFSVQLLSNPIFFVDVVSSLKPLEVLVVLEFPRV